MRQPALARGIVHIARIHKRGVAEDRRFRPLADQNGQPVGQHFGRDPLLKTLQILRRTGQAVAENKAAKTAATASRPGKFLVIVAPPCGAENRFPCFQASWRDWRASNRDSREPTARICVSSLQRMRSAYASVAVSCLFCCVDSVCRCLCRNLADGVLSPSRIASSASSLPRARWPSNTRASTSRPPLPRSKTAPCWCATASSRPSATQVAVPADATIVPCDHCVVTAGFWNTHVHFTEPKWSMAQWKSAATLNPQLADMFLSRGFTTVIDLGSNPADTFSIRRRIEKGELTGPYIYTAGTALYPPHGAPFYLRETMPGWMVRIAAAARHARGCARSIVRRNLASGADVTKLFTGSWVARGHVLPMPLEHRQGRGHHEPSERQARLRPSLQPCRNAGGDPQRRGRAGPCCRRHPRRRCRAAEHGHRQKHGHDPHAQDVHHHRHHRSALHGPDAAPRSSSFISSAARCSSVPTSAT